MEEDEVDMEEDKVGMEEGEVVEELVKRNVAVGRADVMIMDMEDHPRNCANTWTSSAERKCRRTSLRGPRPNWKQRRPPARNGCTARPDQRWSTT